MTDAARTLLVAAVLCVVAAATFVARLRRHEPESHERLIGELRAANAAALLLGATGAATLGFAVTSGAATAALELALALLIIGVAGVLFTRAPREALRWCAIAFLAHALLDIGHRPGWLSTDLFPRSYLIGSALYDGCVAGLCFLARQR